ncbi:hypothetical protein [Lentzea fradiae]|nr:hypothetical protein [Lentzea fradiae]
MTTVGVAGVLASGGTEHGWSSLPGWRFAVLVENAGASLTATTALLRG